MFYSYNAENEKTLVFSTFIDNLIDGNITYKNEVNRVLNEVKDLCLEKKTIFSIDRNYFTIILCLFDSDRDFYQNIDIDQLRKVDYQRIGNTLRSKNEIIYA